MELLIKAQNATELRSKVLEMANLLSETNQGPKTLKVNINMPSGAEHSAEIAAPAPVKAAKGKKAAAPAPEPTPVETSDESMLADEQDNTPQDTGVYSADQVADELRAVIAKCGPNVARDMMAKLGYPHIGKVPKDEYGTFIQSCRENIKTRSKK